MERGQTHHPVLAGCLPLPVQLLAGSSLEDLTGAVVVASTAGPGVQVEQPGTSCTLACCNASIATASLASSSKSNSASHKTSGNAANSSGGGFDIPASPPLQSLAAAALALAPVEYVLAALATTAAHGSNSGIASWHELLPLCRTTLKHLHLLLQQQRLQLRVLSTADMPQQQQQEMSSLMAAAAPRNKRTSKSTLARSPMAALAGSNNTGTDAGAAQFGWVILAVELLPRFFFDSLAQASSAIRTCQASSSQDQQQQQQRVPDWWSLPPGQLEYPPETAAAAINCMMQVLQQQQLFVARYKQLHKLLTSHPQQHQQAVSVPHAPLAATCEASAPSAAVSAVSAAAEDADSDDEDELSHIMQQYSPHQDQPMTSSAAAAAAQPPTAGNSVDRSVYHEQFELLCCPDTAAAAATDVRQSMFDFVDSQPWKMEREDPPGLTCQLYRYQRRALSWMVWREQQQQWHGRSSSSSGGVGCGQLLLLQQEQHQATEGMFGTRLLNPLWNKVTLTLPPELLRSPKAATAGGTRNAAQDRAASAGAPTYQGQQQQQPPPQQQQQVVVYHAVSHGLVSQVCPAAYQGPSGGMLCDEMGIGKTVEVFALLLARPPPAHRLGHKRAAGDAADALNQANQAADAENHHIMATSDADDDSGDEQYGSAKQGAAAKRQRLADSAGSNHVQDRDEHHYQQQQEAAAMAKAANEPYSAANISGSDGSWPAEGKWAGGTLVVAPPAILQQWVAEAHKRTTGLKVQVYDGLKWQRAQAEAAARKQAGRQSRQAQAAAAAVAAWQYMVDGPPDAPMYDATAEASAAVDQLLQADVVLTTYDVLQQEVYFSGSNSERLSSLRHKKRYQVPESPLLQVDWWRLVFDEAQQVGPLSNTAVMAGYLRARHRWVVTGTPIGAGGLSDVGNLLRLINASPFHDTHVFKSAIERPFYTSVEAAQAALKGAAEDGAEDAAEDVPEEHGAIDSDDDMDGIRGDIMGDITQPPQSDDFALQQQGGRRWRQASPAVAAEASGSEHSAVEAALSKVLRPRYGRPERAGVRRLLALLQPLMWRTSKAAAYQDHPLPPRHLQCAYLRFSPAEQSFYDHILEKTAAAKRELEEEQQRAEEAAATAAAMAASDDVTVRATEAAAGRKSSSAAAAAAASSSPQRGRKGGGKRAGKGKGGKGSNIQQDLQQLAADQIAQLRRACVHPQLTSYWKELSNELQLQRGGALSIAEILGRMRDAAQLKLQAAERELCSLLNARASILMSKADEAAAEEDAAVAAAAGSSRGSSSPGKRKGKKRKRSVSIPSTAAEAAAADRLDADDDDPAQAGHDACWTPNGRNKQQTGSKQQRQKKRVRFADAETAAGDHDDDAEATERAAAAAAAAAAADGGSMGGSRRRSSSDGLQETASPEDLRATAWKLLEDSWAVAQHGIRAVLPGSSCNEVDEPLGDIAGGDATWKAWRLVELHTAQLAARLASVRHQPSEVSVWRSKVTKKQEELLESSVLEVDKANARLEKYTDKASDLERQLESSWSQAAPAGVPLEAMTGCVDGAAWLSSFSDRLSAAKAVEQSNRQQVTNEASGSVVTTVLLTQHVPQLLTSLEAAAASDRTLLEGILGTHQTQQLLSLLRHLEGPMTTAASAGAAVAPSATSGSSGPGSSRAMNSSAAKATRGAASGMPMRRRTAVATAQGSPADNDDYLPSDDPETVHSDNDDTMQDDNDDVMVTNDAPPGGNRTDVHGSKRHQQQAEQALSSAVVAWKAGSNLAALQHPMAAVGATATAVEQRAGLGCDPVAAATAATYQFLDCVPERRVLWRLLFKGSVSPASPQQQQQEQQQQQHVNLSTSPATVAALGSLLTVYLATAFSSGRRTVSAPVMAAAGADSSSIARAVGHGDLSSSALVPRGSGVTAAVGPVPATLQSLQHYQSRLCCSKGLSLVRQVLRHVSKKHAGYVRSVSAAVSTADAAAEALVKKAADAGSAADAAAQLGEGFEEAAAAADAAAAAVAAHVNIPRLLQALPLDAVAAAAEAARLRVELCRLHRDVHQAELKLEVAQHNKQQVQEEADAAAAGQLTQALALAGKGLTELARLSEEAIKKCDELARHKRFLDNQATESRVLADAAKRKKAAAGPSAAAQGGADVSGEGAMVDEDESEVECAVCRSPMSEELQVFACGHYYCDGCAQQALSVPKPTCPYCRKPISRNGVFRVSLGSAGGVLDPEVNPPEGPAVRAMKVTGSWMTKIEALLRRLLLMRESEPDAKALVFSQYPDALALISKALNVMQLDHVSLGVSSGRQAMRDAIKKFTENEDVRVFLLSLRAGSAGLTLTAATHVFLLEPALDSAIEQQAVARVHRIGQEKEVMITRLLVADTVEEEVLKASEAKQALLTDRAATHHKHQHQQHHKTNSSNHKHQHKEPEQPQLRLRQQQQQQQGNERTSSVLGAAGEAWSAATLQSAAAAAADASRTDAGVREDQPEQMAPTSLVHSTPQQHQSLSLLSGSKKRYNSNAAAAAAAASISADEAMGLLQTLIKHKNGVRS